MDIYDEQELERRTFIIELLLAACGNGVFPEDYLIARERGGEDAD